MTNSDLNGVRLACKTKRAFMHFSINVFCCWGILALAGYLETKTLSGILNSLRNWDLQKVALMMSIFIGLVVYYIEPSKDALEKAAKKMVSNPK